jgi:tetratricopeptide (TPR) repeat protein
MFIAKNNVEGGGLGAQLDRLEMLISKLGTGVKQPEEIPMLMDQIETQFGELQEQGASVREASAQYETCQAGLRSAAGAFLKEMGGSGALQAARQAHNPDREAWWWYLDEYQASQRQARLRQGLKTLLIVAVVLAAGLFVYQRFFAPDPKTLAVYSASTDADRLAGQGQVAEALAAVEEGLAVVPNNPELLIRKAVLFDLSGLTVQAQDIFSQALSLSASQESYYLTRCQVYLAIGKYDLAIQDGQTVIATNPNSAVAYTLIGSALELKGKLQDAYASYEKALELSSDQNDQLTAQVKIKMAYLLQSMSSPIFTTPTP